MIITYPFCFWALVATPLKARLLHWIEWTAFQINPAVVQRAFVARFPMSTWVSIAVGGLVVGIMLFPDVTRFARSPTHAVLACCIAITTGFPLILILAGYPSSATHGPELVSITLNLALGLPALAAILFSARSANTYSLYASTLMWSTVVTNRRRWKIAVSTGVAGLALGLRGLAEQLPRYLMAFGVAILPIGGIYSASYYWVRHITDKLRFGMTLAAVATTVENVVYLSLTSVPAWDRFFRRRPHTSLSSRFLCVVVLRSQYEMEALQVGGPQVR
ncbi:hypothetical protein PQR66_26945 [Paraburkholderia agricolaris]|uniref:Uncharacterized protein n=1 Tax=Paraburkholderia agricolaris TaxID=2152888 RepID=A0ABW8ZWI6_9BURK